MITNTTWQTYITKANALLGEAWAHALEGDSKAAEVAAFRLSVIDAFTFASLESAPPNEHTHMQLFNHLVRVSTALMNVVPGSEQVDGG